MTKSTANQVKRGVSRIGARQSAARRCPTCSGPLRQIGDPRMDHRGWEYRRRVCEATGCSWTGIELRALMDAHLMAIIADSLDEQLRSRELIEERELLDLIGGDDRD